MLIIEDEESVEYGEYDLWAFKLHYEPASKPWNEGWAADVVRIHNNKFDTAFLFRAHYINRYAQRYCHRSKWLRQNDKELAAKYVKEIIKDYYMAYIMMGNRMQSEKYPPEKCDFGKTADNVVAYTCNGMGCGYINAQRTYIMMVTYVDEDNMKSTQTEERNKYYKGRFIKKIYK